ncbi:phospholipase A, partial [Campylobacter coli]|nr:phospholipase [Campylobacter coli]EID1227291.1 phospholipase A [Campylobacter coli]
MKKILFLIFFYSLVFCDDFEQALEFEKKGQYEKAMQIYKKLALQNSPKQDLKENNASLLSSIKHETQNTQKTPSTKEDFSRIALANYLGENSSFNPLGISSYKMNYFLPFAYSFGSLGGENRKTEMKFQLSIKKRLFEDLLGLGEKYYVGYTQTSWWQNYKHSSPFRETNYQPEFFVDIPLHFED